MKAEIYSKNNCVFCDKAKMRLSKYNPTIFMLDKDFTREEFFQKFPNAKIIYSGGNGTFSKPKLKSDEVANIFYKQLGVNTDRIIYKLIYLLFGVFHGGYAGCGPSAMVAPIS